MNYLIIGTSFHLIDAEIAKIVGNRIKSVYSLEEVDLKNIIEEVSYNSLFSEERLLVLYDFDSLSTVKKEDEKNLKVLEDYLTNPNPQVTLIFVSKSKPTRGIQKKLLALLKPIETQIITKTYELAQVFSKQIRIDGYSCPEPVLAVFLEKCANNYDIAINEWNKLKSMCLKKDITLNDVYNFVSNYNMSDSFGFKDAVVNLDLRTSWRMLEDLETSKMEPIGLVVMLANEYTCIYNIKLLTDMRLNNDEISRRMDNMHPYRVKVLRATAGKYTLKKLEEIILHLCNLDKRMVSEDNLGYDEVRKFLLTLA